ncbi:MAG: glycosyltransferase family 4 protein [Bacteroidales bacterium]|nr:glycosyltransferase family 4 protein [Bacteroidales bacterium]
MIIGFDAKRAFNNKTGLGNYSRMVISRYAMEHRENTCILYTPSIDEELEGYFKGIANVSSRRPMGLSRCFKSLWREYGMSRRVHDDEVDIFHGLSHELPYGLGREVRKVVTMHDLVAWRFPHYFKKIDAHIHQRKQRHACRVADIVVAISEQTKRDLIDIMHVPEEKIRVIYQSCDDIFWYPIEQYDLDQTRKKYELPNNYLVCVGTVEERKNQLSVVRAMQQVPEDISLVIVGRLRGSYGSMVLDEIERLKLRKRVIVIDDADFDDFPYLYALSRGAVYMSLFEGFGIPIVEALCCGVPVLTSNCSSMPEAGGDAAIYADPTNVDEIARQMTLLATDENLRADLLAKGPAQRDKFAPARITADFHSLYTSLVQDLDDKE